MTAWAIQLVLAAALAVVTIPAHFFGLRQPWPAATHPHLAEPTWCR